MKISKIQKFKNFEIRKLIKSICYCLYMWRDPRKGTYDPKVKKKFDCILWRISSKTYWIAHYPKIDFFRRRSLFSDRVTYIHITFLHTGNSRIINEVNNLPQWIKNYSKIFDKLTHPYYNPIHATSENTTHRRSLFFLSPGTFLYII